MATKLLLLACIWIGCVTLVKGQIGAPTAGPFNFDITTAFASVIGALVAQNQIDTDINTLQSPPTRTSTLANEANGCPANWHLYNGFCYVVTPSPRNYLTTRNTCLTMGGYLANFEDEAEFNNLRDTVLQSRNAIPTFVGFNDHIQEGNFVNDIVNDTPNYLPFIDGDGNVFGPGPGDCGVARGNFVTTFPCVQSASGLCKRRQNSVLTYSGL
ncbi:uncharacterized protein LOC117325465 [Pecten maximus]|uniref:uncharacterized protein LOC117325465 n=1 Tax=Pecten maximus TaxID=6579 RepID=UPI0014583B68|nr:uncharacterized protein LOC117325465 [Pecten maximus]